MKNTIFKLAEYFYYFSFIDNFESIMSNGILAKNDIKQKKLITKSFADVDVQNFRKDMNFFISGSLKKNLHDLILLTSLRKTGIALKRSPTIP